MEENGDGDADIYDDLPDFRYDETLEKLNATIAQLELQNNELLIKLDHLKKEKEVLESNCNVLTTNISSLLKTAKQEIIRKERTISDLRKQLSDANFGSRFKRRYIPRNDCNTENTAKSNFKNNRENRERSPVETKRRRLDNGTFHNVDMPVKEQLKSFGNTTKNYSPSQHSSHVNNALNRVHNVGKDLESHREKTIIPSKTSDFKPPQLDCPTVFSRRMYQKLYGTNKNSVIKPAVLENSCKNEDNKNADVVPTPLSIESQGGQCNERRPDNQGKLLNGQLTIFPEKTGPPAITMNDSVEAKCDEVLPMVTKEKVPSNKSLACPVVVNNERFLKSSPTQVSESTLQPGKTSTDTTSNVPKKSADSGLAGTEHDAVVSSIENVSKHVLKTRVDSQAIHLKSTPQADINSVNRSLKENVEMKANNRINECFKNVSSVRLGVRKTFTPISNNWKCYQDPPNPSDKSKLLEGSCSNEISCQLMVKTDETMTEEKKNHILETMFGSPVKWAEDVSSDSSDKEKSQSSKSGEKLIETLFGSPLKCTDSSSEPPKPFCPTSSAYEDSYTNQPLEKSSLNKTSAILLKGVPPPRRNALDFQFEHSNPEGNNEKVAFPPPSQPVGKKVHSIFSPSKSSRSSLHSMIHETKSSLGLYNSFKRDAKYDDSVLGQFDDTAQFVSALAKVESQLSPLRTPIKPADCNESQTVTPTVSPNPISFEKVLQGGVIQENVSTSEVKIGGCTRLPSNDKNQLFDISGGIQKASIVLNEETPVTSVPSALVDDGKMKNLDSFVQNSSPNKTTSSSNTSTKFIHRSNFSSSSIFTINCDSQTNFSDKPINILHPRKAPRIVTKNSFSVSTNLSDKDIKANTRIAINDSFIIEQEERVRQWEKEKLFEMTVRSSTSPRTPSPTKTYVKLLPHNNYSEELGAQPLKSSPKTATKKPASPNRGPRQPKLTETTKSNGQSNSLPVIHNSACSSYNNTNITTKALNMIISYVDKSITTIKSNNVTNNKPKVVVETKDINKLLKVEKVNEGPKSSETNRNVKSMNQSHKYPRISQVAVSTPLIAPIKNAVCKSIVSSTLKPLIIKKPSTKKDSDFKRSSALKRGGYKRSEKRTSSLSQFSSESLASKAFTTNNNKSLTPSRLEVSSTPVNRRNSETSFRCTPGSKQLDESDSKLKSSSMLVQEKMTNEGGQEKNRDILNRQPGDGHWVLRPIDLMVPKSAYQTVNPNVSTDDPRSHLDFIKLRCPSSDREKGDGCNSTVAGTSNDVQTKPTENLNCHKEIEISFPKKSSVLGVAGGESNNKSKSKVSSEIVSSTPFISKEFCEKVSQKQSLDDCGLSPVTTGVKCSVPRVLTALNDINKDKLSKIARPFEKRVVLLHSVPKQETSSRGRKRKTSAQHENPPKENCADSRGNTKNQRSKMNTKPYVTEKPTKISSSSSPCVFQASTKSPPASEKEVHGVSSHTSQPPQSSLTPSKSPESHPQCNKVIKLNRRNVNFGTTSTVHSAKVISPGKRPASFCASD